jgi:hypothetical protein
MMSPYKLAVRWGEVKPFSSGSVSLTDAFLTQLLIEPPRVTVRPSTQRSCHVPIKAILTTALYFESNTIPTLCTNCRFTALQRSRRGEVKSSLGSSNLPARHEDVLGNGGINPPLLTLALGGREWPTSCAGRFIPWRTAFGNIVQKAGWAKSLSGPHTEEKTLLWLRCRKLRIRP